MRSAYICKGKALVIRCEMERTAMLLLHRFAYQQIHDKPERNDVSLTDREASLQCRPQIETLKSDRTLWDPKYYLWPCWQRLLTVLVIINVGPESSTSLNPLKDQQIKKITK